MSNTAEKVGGYYYHERRKRLESMVHALVSGLAERGTEILSDHAEEIVKCADKLVKAIDGYPA